MALWILSGITQVSQYQKDNTRKANANLDSMEQETVSGSGISWAICKSAPCPRQISMPASHHSSFLQAGCPSCCPTNSVKALKAYQSTEGITEGNWEAIRWVNKAITELATCTTEQMVNCYNTRHSRVITQTLGGHWSGSKHRWILQTRVREEWKLYSLVFPCCCQPPSVPHLSLQV